MEWLWSPSDSLNICFCGTWRCTTYNSVPIILILLTNKNVALIYSVTICEQTTKDCAPLGSFQHKVKHCCFYLRCLPSFITSSLYYGFKYRCFSHLPGDAPMRGSWTFQIKQMVTDVMNEIMGCHTGCKIVGYSKCPGQEGSFGLPLSLIYNHLQCLGHTPRMNFPKTMKQAWLCGRGRYYWNEVKGNEIIKRHELTIFGLFKSPPAGRSLRKQVICQKRGWVLHEGLQTQKTDKSTRLALSRCYEPMMKHEAVTFFSLVLHCFHELC